MADRDPEEDGIFKEIDEELRREHYGALWKKYGNYVIGVAVAMIAIVGAFKWWQAEDLERRAEQSVRFNAALNAMARNKAKEAELVLADLAEKGSAGYAMLAGFNQAALLARRRETAAAAALYKKLAADTGIDPIFRDLALVLASLVELDSGDPTELSGRLEGLMADGNPWRHSAREIAALLARRTGDKPRAVKLFRELANDASVPVGIRERAAEMTAILGG